MEFGIGAGVTRNLSDGAFRWSKKFSDRFSRFDTIPECETASLVAVAITLHAKASSLKTRFLEMKQTRIDQPPKVPWEPWAYLVPFPR